jgi:hypothetical protein
MLAYRKAHRGRLEIGDAERRTRHLSLLVPDFGNDKANTAFDKAMSEFVQKMTSFMRKPGGEE